MQERVNRTASDPDVVRATAGLASYVRELVLTGRKRIRDCADYEEVVWLGDMPPGSARPGPSPDGRVLTLDYLPRSAPPALPRLLDGWVDDDSLRDPAGGDPRLAAEGPIEVLTTDENGSTSHVKTVPRREAAEVTRAYEQWLPSWHQWAETELTARPHRELYERLARIARVLSQQDETLEAVLGLGLLTWRDPQGQLGRVSKVTAIR
jgi:hypothetical protein